MNTKVSSFILLCGILISCANSRKSEQGLKPQEIIEQSKIYPEVVEVNEKNIWIEIEKKATYFKTDLDSENNLNNLPKEFIVFAERFKSDSIYQLQHIDFNLLLGAIGECDTTIIINSDNWDFFNWDFLKDFTNGNEIESIEKWGNRVYVSDSRIYFEYFLKEVGMIYQIGFEKANDRWFLTLYKINVC